MVSQDQTEVVPFLTSAATIVYLQKWLKTRNLYVQFVKAFPGADKYAHWFVAGLMSLVTAAGIHAVWDGTLTSGGKLTIEIPSALLLLHGLSDWFKVYVLQATIYDSHLKPFPPGTTVLAEPAAPAPEVKP